jgi:ubiquinone/menaquinone biosynthesis C-methylase UbiE
MPSMNPQEDAFDNIYSRDSSQWAFHYTKDPLTRYLRDRRLNIALDLIEQIGRISLATQSALVVCGGVGGEGTYLCNRGLVDVTISDFSAQALHLCNKLDPRLKTLQLNSESLDLPDNSYDLVLVQDGLHHLSRPVLGFTEMLRVARKAIVVIEPHFGFAGRLLGTTWEQQGDATNYVFRWNRAVLEQSTRSYLLSDSAEVKAMRLWDHNLVVGKMVNHLPQRNRLFAAKCFYKTLEPFSSFGNMMVGVVLKA